MLRPQYVIPQGYPDELLFGIVGRLGRSLGVKRVEQMIGRPGQQMINLSAFGLAGLHWLVNPENYQNPDEVVAQYARTYSPLRYLLPFTRRGQSHLLATSVMAPRNDPLSYTAAMLARQFDFGSRRDWVPRVLRWCPECRVADKIAVGESYWHLSHQLPCSIVCAIHDVVLSCERVIGNLSPRPRGVNDGPNKRAPSSNARARLFALARSDRAVLESGLLGFLGRRVRFAYEDILGIRNQTTAIRSVAIHQALRAFDSKDWREILALLDWPPTDGMDELKLCDLLDNEHHPGSPFRVSRTIRRVIGD